MITDPAEKLRELALSVTRGDLRRPWSVQTSNSFRRIGTDRGDGDVLCAVTQRYDGHPDLHAAPDVLDYIVAAHPLVILQLLRERDAARHALLVESWEKIVRGPISEVCEDSVDSSEKHVDGDDKKVVRGLISEVCDDSEELVTDRVEGSEKQADDVDKGPREKRHVIAPEVLRGLRAMACALTALQAEHPDVRAACKWLAETLQTED